MARTVFVLANRLNLRIAPEDGDVVAVLPHGQLLDVVASPTGSPPPGWLEVTTTFNLSDLRGFIAERYVADVGAQPGSDATSDGSLAVTVAKLQRLTPTGRPDILGALGQEFDTVAAGFGITQSALRVCHFLAQAAHETMRFQTLRELGGPAYFAKYDGRKDLGNSQPGDGARFHGRGIFQLTGRSNYEAMTKRLNIDLVKNPDEAMRPSTSLQIACLFWATHKLNDLADQDHIEGITRRINGGLNGLAERRHMYQKARSIWA
jgi:putative chitinase